MVFVPTLSFGLDVLDVRLGVNAPKTRFVLETNTATQPSKVFLLQNPPRLVIDIPKLRRQKVSLAKVNIPPRSIIKKVRDGAFNRSTHRFVLELTTKADYNYFALPAKGRNNPRLVVDLTPKNKTFVAHKKQPKKEHTLKTKKAKPFKKTSPPVEGPLVIIIDAGHGGIDPGAIGRKGTREKDVVLSMARRVVKKLNKEANIKAYLTRDKDTFLKLQERVNKAKSLKADLFISLHADAHKSRKVRGGSVYVLSERASEREAERLSILANRGVAPLGGGLKGAGKDGVVQDILIDLAQRDTMNSSAFLAKSIIKEMDKVTHMRRTDILFAGFKVLKAPDIPSILIELAYMSNPEEERKLRSAAFQEKLATSVARGIIRYTQR